MNSKALSQVIKEMYAVVKVRGSVDASETISKTLDSLGLGKKNQVLFVDESNDSLKGMLDKAKDYIAYGEVSEEVVELIEDEKDVEVTAGDRFSMSPPSGGFKTTKKNFSNGGALGERPSMNGLLQKMI